MSTILDDWSISAEYLTAVVRENPSLRGMMLGYVSEHKAREIFEGDPRASKLRKDDDHDRRKKGDLVCTYRGREFIIEVKSLQTNSTQMRVDGRWIKRIIRVNGKYIENPEYLELWPDHRDTAQYKGGAQSL